MFDSFRGEFGFTYYGERRTSASIDIPLAVVVYICILISIATIVAAIGIRGKARWYTLIRVVYSLAIGSTILLCLFGDCWVDGVDKKVSVPYIYRSDTEISGEVGLRIGLSKVNITLKGYFENSKGSVKYNEAIDFDGVVGTASSFREYLERGLPQPVLTVVEFFSVDSGGFRWGRSFAVAGYFAKILLLTAFAFWVLANIMICSVIFYGGALFTLTGLTLFTASILYHCLLPTIPLKFFCSESEFHLHYGICFWSILFMGLLTTCVGLVILFMDSKMPNIIQKFFLIEDKDVKEDAYETQQKNSVSSNATLYKKNDFKRISLHNNHYSMSDLNKAGSLFSVAEVNSQSNTPQIRRSATNPTNLRNSFSLESLRDYAENNTLKNISKNDKQYKSNPLFNQNETVDRNDSYPSRRMSIIPGRLQSAMSLESLTSISDSKGPSSDSGLDDSQHINESKELEPIPSESDNNDDNSDNIDISMFEMREPVGRTESSQEQGRHDNGEDNKPQDRHDNGEGNKVFTINVETTDNEEERLREIYVDLSSAYP